MLGVVGAAGAIAATTATVRADRLAATPHAFAVGRVWLLVTSAFVADRPAAASIAGFAVVGAVTIAVAGTATTAVAAAVGHIGSAAAVYLALGLVRIFVPSAFDGVVDLPDFGTSAIIAAWIGAIAAQGWRRRPELTARTVVVAFCLGSGLIGWLLRPDVTVLDAEHLIAFLIGVLLAQVGRARVPQEGRS